MSFVVVPQWQGSPSSRAMRLAQGADAIRSDLPAARTHEVAVPLEAGDAQGTGIARYGSVRVVRERLMMALEQAPQPTIVIGGDCSVSAGAIAHVASDDVAVVWFDVHPDLNTPETSPSGAFAGMVLASLIADGIVPASRIVLAGTRSWDDAEGMYAAQHGIPAVPVTELATPTALLDAVAATGVSRVYVHIDLDVLDPMEFTGLLEPIPFGVTTLELVQALKALVAQFPLAGATIASFAPESEAAAADDAPTILRLIAALRS